MSDARDLPKEVSDLQQQVVLVHDELSRMEQVNQDAALVQADVLKTAQQTAVMQAECKERLSEIERALSEKAAVQPVSEAMDQEDQEDRLALKQFRAIVSRYYANDPALAAIAAEHANALADAAPAPSVAGVPSA